MTAHQRKLLRSIAFCPSWVWLAAFLALVSRTASPGIAVLGTLWKLYVAGCVCEETGEAVGRTGIARRTKRRLRTEWQKTFPRTRARGRGRAQIFRSRFTPLIREVGWSGLGMGMGW